MRDWIRRHRTKLTFAGVILAVMMVAALGYVYHLLNRPFLPPEIIVAKRVSAAAQNEAAIFMPPPSKAKMKPKNRDRNVYFGDLHVHSRLSFDSYIFGNRLSVDEAYRFAKGEEMDNAVGEKMQLSAPLDFAAITDHAESFGLFEGCAQPNKSAAAERLCQRFETPNANFFLELREAGEKRPMQRLPLGPPEQQIELARSTWQHVTAMAEKHNNPGRFTSFAAYEYSPPLKNRGKLHRNIIFRNSYVSAYAISAFEAATEIDVWQHLATNCRAPCEAISIPHNPNKSWGLAFAGITIDGDVYRPQDWAMRRDYEPLVEMFQIKGNSECAIGVGTKDEACGFEQFLPVCADDAEIGITTSCIHQTSMARDGLKFGLRLKNKLGFNPLKFGMIGSTDTHNSTPGDAEEWDFRGASGVLSAPAEDRINTRGSRGRELLERNPGGLVAVWAAENTRNALFDAMQRKEVYATSGTRIRLRFFGSFQNMTQVMQAAHPARAAYRLGVPMGGHLKPQAGQTGGVNFFVWALRDPHAAPLDKVQIVKAWLQDGEVKEQIFDVACSNGRVADPTTRKCAPLKPSPDKADCRLPKNIGAGELKAIWQDSDYEANAAAFYYSRVIQVPSCRWSSYDAIRLQQAPPNTITNTTTDMAWSSPVWIDGAE